MTVKELIKALKQCDQKANVLIASDPEGNGLWAGDPVMTHELFHTEWKELVNIPDHDHSLDAESEKMERVCVIWVDHPRHDG